MPPKNPEFDEAPQPEVVDGEIDIIYVSTSQASLSMENQTSHALISTTSSEDIQILEERKTKYLSVQVKIKAVIRTDEGRKDVIIEDIVDAALRLGEAPTYTKVLTLGLSLLAKYFKRKKLKKVIENILEKVFDVSLNYSVDYEDLKWTCDYIGGQNYFNRMDHRAIYIAIIQKLKSGPIRDECITNGIVHFVNEK